MSQFTLSDIKAKLGGDRGDCPLCGGTNTLCASENGKLLLWCQKCNAPFIELIEALGATPATNYAPIKRNPVKPKPTHAEAAAKARRIWEAAGGGK